LFALPHPQSFSGEAWLTAPPPPALSFDWSEKPSWLSLATDSLGELFTQFAETNRFENRRSVKSDTALTMPKLSPRREVQEESRVRVGGELAQRRLLSQPDLPAWEHNDTLTNTVVRVLVDAAGQTISADLVSGSGLAAADQNALAQASNARFEPVEQTGPERNQSAVQGLTWGDLIFEWQTLPVPMTNAPGR
jgi:TonB family protein